MKVAGSAAVVIGPGKPFLYHGITITPTKISRSARARELYEAMKQADAKVHAE